jgi:Flp pilus assembly protein TadD
MQDVRPLARPSHVVSAASLARVLRGAALMSTLALGACAGATNPFDFASVAEKPAAQSDVATGSIQQPQTELQKATDYWGKQHEKNPKDPQAAINYVRNLKALGAKEQAMAVIQQAYSINPSHRGIASEYGRLAVEQEQLSVAEKLLAQADDPVAPDWKVISARGTVMAKQGKYREAIPHFERALALAPGQPSLLNNLALAHAMDGHAEKAEPLLRQAQQNDQADPKVGYNLSLVLGLQGKSEDAKSVILKTAPVEYANDDTALVKALVGAPAPRAAAISTGSTNQAKPKPSTKIVKTATPAKIVRADDAAKEDPTVLVRRLADGYTATPKDAPVQLVPKR